MENAIADRLAALKQDLRSLVATAEKSQILPLIHEFCAKYNRHQTTVQAYINGSDRCKDEMMYEVLISFFQSKLNN